ncbi:MAG: response regulator [Anaerolineales bacterium]|nr:response regulator [Anaerolineales bacterium]
MRILLADGRSKVRFALRVLLEQRSGLTVVGEIEDANNLLEGIEESSPDIVLLDWELPGLEGSEMVPIVRGVFPDLKIIVLSGMPEARFSSQNVGVDAFVNKTEPPERLLAAIGWNGKE